MNYSNRRKERDTVNKWVNTYNQLLYDTDTQPERKRKYIYTDVNILTQMLILTLILTLV